MATQKQGTRATRNMENFVRSTDNVLMHGTPDISKDLIGRHRMTLPVDANNVLFRVESKLQKVENSYKGQINFAFTGEVNANALTGRRGHVGDEVSNVIIGVHADLRYYGASLLKLNADWKERVYENSDSIARSCKFVVADAVYVSTMGNSLADARYLIYIVASGFFGPNLSISRLDIPMERPQPGSDPTAIAASEETEEEESSI